MDAVRDKMFRGTSRNEGRDASQAGPRPVDHELSVIVPAYNEERRLPRTLAAMRDRLDEWGGDYRVVVVDDGSCDGTAQCADDMGWRFSTFRMPWQSGKGAAVRAGMLQATGSVVSFTDADLPFDLDALFRGFDWIRSNQCDVVFGARDLEEAEEVACRKVSRSIASFCFRQFVQLLISVDVTDTQCGLKLFRRDAARRIFSRTLVDGFAFDAEVVLLAARLGYRSARVPVSLINDYGSTLSLTRHAAPMLVDVLCTRVRDLCGMYGTSIEAVPVFSHEI
jgi:dolichyl-phosphate beta-glucosyltransferase